MRSKYLLPVPLVITLSVPLATPAQALQRPLQLASLFDGISGLFDRKKAHLQELIDNHQYEDAETFYIANKAALDQSKGIESVLGTLSDKLNERYTSGADDIIGLLNGLQVPVTPSSWPYALNSLKQAQALIDKYNQFPTLAQAPYRSPKIARLTDAMAHGTAILQDSAGATFAAYDHSNADFFDKYPVPLSTDKKQNIIEDNEDKWLVQMAGLSQDKATALIKAYAPFVHSDKGQAALGQAYEKALLGWNGWKEPLEIDKAWSMGSRFQSVGIDPRYIPVMRAVLILTGANPGPIPPGWDADTSAYGVPYLIGSGAELDKEIVQLTAKGIQYFAIVDPSRTVTINTLTQPVSITGSRITGTQQETNPDYTRAKQAVDDATADYSAAEQEKAASASQAASAGSSANALGGSMLGAIGSAAMGMAASSSASSSVAAAQAKLTAARAALAATPATINQNITEPYTYLGATAEHITEQQVGVYFLDVRNAVVYREKIEGSTDDTDNVYTRVDARDPQKADLDSKTKIALEKFRHAATVIVKSAPQLLPDILNNPIAGSRRQAADLDQIISDDQAIFQHKSTERVQDALTQSQKVATLIGVTVQWRPTILGYCCFRPCLMILDVMS